MPQPSPLAAAQDHAQALAATGDLAGARLTLQQALESGRAALGEDDPAVLATAHQLAVVHQQADDPSAARRVLEEAFAAGQWKLGDADPLMLAISFDIGVVAEELGNRHEARRAFGRVAAVGPTVLGDDHWAVTRARAYLGEDPPTVRLELPVPPVRPAPRPEPAPAPLLPPALPPPVPPAPVERQPSAPPATWQEPRPQEPRPHEPRTHEPRPPEPRPHESRPPEPQWQEPQRHDVAVRVDRRADQLPEQRFGPAPLVAVERPLPAYRKPARTSRGPAVFAAIAAGLAAVIAVVALVVVLADRDRAGESDVPTLGGGRPPSDVRLRETGSTVQVTWSDPTDGTVSFMVTGAHSGEPLALMGRAGPGQTQLTLNGLNAGLDYCFAVVAVYGGGRLNTSPTTCTARSRAEPDTSATD